MGLDRTILDGGDANAKPRSTKAINKPTNTQGAKHATEVVVRKIRRADFGYKSGLDGSRHTGIKRLPAR
jgi:hypothetical protein